MSRNTIDPAVHPKTASAWPIRVLDREGASHEVRWSAGQSLMEALRDNDLPVLASCGGTASCATCHVFVPADVVDRLGERSDDEQELLEETDAFDPSTSRLSCQVEPDAAMAGMTVVLAPEEE